jgi:hypothetical protein
MLGKQKDKGKVLGEIQEFIDEFDELLPGEEIVLKKGTKTQFTFVMEEVPLPKYKKLLLAVKDLYVFLIEKEYDLKKIDNFDINDMPKLIELVEVAFDQVTAILYELVQQPEEWFIDNNIGLKDSIRLLVAGFKVNDYEDVIKKVISLLPEDLFSTSVS